MKLKPKQTIADYFSDLDDPRVERTKRHQLIDIITIAIAGCHLWSRRLGEQRNLRSS